MPKKKPKKRNKSDKSDTIKRIADHKARVLRALSNSHGIITDACRIGKIGRAQFYQWKDTDKDFATRVKEINEEQIDDVEGRLLRGIREGKEVSTIFFLKTKGKARGYLQTLEIKPASDDPIDLSMFTNQELREMAEINDRAQARAKKSASAA